MNLVLMLLVVAATPARFTVFGCDDEIAEDAELVHALELEVQRTFGDVTRCGDVWRFDSKSFEPVIVNLTGTPAHLRPRTFALAVQTSLRPRAPEQPVVWPAPPPPPQPARVAPSVQVQLDLGARLFVIPPLTATGDLVVRAMTKWRFWGGVELGLTSVPNHSAEVRSFLALGVLGVRVFEVPLEKWSFVGDLAAEIGVLTTTTISLRYDWRGANFVNVMFGGWALVGFQRALADEVSLQFALRAGYDRGARIVLIGVPASTLDGPFVGLQLGIRL